jgi:hypothetical protein
MGRKKINTEEKKQHLSVVISPENFNRLKNLELNESKFINWLLEEHFNQIENRRK